MSENSSVINNSNNDRGGEEDDPNVVTMVDVLQEESELEEDANAVLGGSDPLNCTYPKGYVKRQALYACLSCIPPDNKHQSGGICLACSYSCHEGHDLVELYTKRNFRCDCGTGAFGGKKCSLEPVKEVNVKNKYNQNFQGLYCTCNRPYPDPEVTVEDEMIQCIVCEDWYHGKHLETSLPNDYEEMICGSCMSDHPFLWKYTSLCLTGKPTGNINESTCTSHENHGSVSSIDSASETPAPSIPSVIANSPEKTVISPATQNGQSRCVLPDFKEVQSWKGAAFWPEGWRKQLCACHECQKVYSSAGAEYLIDMQDTVQYYEQQGKEKASSNSGASQYDRAMQALSRLDRVKQVEAIHGYNDMKDQLKEYLQKFAENGKVVREEDIREFFTEMSRKRQRVDVPTFCR